MSNGFRIVYATYINSTQGFIQDFQFGGGGGGDVVCGLTGMSEYFSHHAQNGTKSIVVSFC